MTRAAKATAAIAGIVLQLSALLLSALLLSGCATPSGPATSSPAPAREEIYILRSIREPRQATAGWCSSTRTGFEPFPTDAERFFSFWSLALRPEDGRAVETKVRRVAELRGCFGATAERGATELSCRDQAGRAHLPR